jgi:hypothetical protein
MEDNKTKSQTTDFKENGAGVLKIKMKPFLTLSAM